MFIATLGPIKYMFDKLEIELISQNSIISRITNVDKMDADPVVALYI